ATKAATSATGIPDENASMIGGMAFNIDNNYHGYTDSVYRAEFSNEPETGFLGGRELCGNSIVPYIIKGADDENKNTALNRKFVIKNDKLGIAKHYLEKHCYFNFQAFGDDFCQYYGITPLNNSQAYGIN
ncbi:5460_t:CDS:1, partial [Scutellospora calospora]